MTTHRHKRDESDQLVKPCVASAPRAGPAEFYAGLKPLVRQLSPPPLFRNFWNIKSRACETTLTPPPLAYNLVARLLHALRERKPPCASPARGSRLTILVSLAHHGNQGEPDRPLLTCTHKSRQLIAHTVTAAPRTRPCPKS